MHLCMMKKALLYLFVFTYTLSVIKPTMPYLYDAVAHAFFYQHHLSTVHTINGKQHVHHEFIRDVKKEKEEGNALALKKLVPTDEHVFLPFTHGLAPFTLLKPFYSPGYPRLCQRTISGNYPPPKHQVVSPSI
jgi:hypothetical protein